jgi:putative multiple sugar transport system permease protein
MTGTANLKELMTRNLRQSGIFIAFVAIVVFFTILTEGVLLSPGKLSNVVLQFSYILILAIGMVIVIIGGHIDLSVGSVVALTGAVSAVVVIQQGMPFWAGVLAAIGTGLLVGAWQGFWVAVVGIPAFIVTLAGMLLFRGMTLLVLGNISLSPFPTEYTVIASGFLEGFMGGTEVDVFTVVIGVLAAAGYVVSAARKRMGMIRYEQTVESMSLFLLRIGVVSAVVIAFAWRLAQSRGLPVVLIILAVLIITYTLVTNKSVFGRHVYAIGGNQHAAELSGVKVRKINFWLREHGPARLDRGHRVLLTLQRRAARCRGDVRAGRDSGGLHRWCLGQGRCRDRHRCRRRGLIMGVMANGMQLMGIGQSVQSVVRGLVLLLAVAFDVYNKRRATATG